MLVIWVVFLAVTGRAVADSAAQGNPLFTVYAFQFFALLALFAPYIQRLFNGSGMEKTARITPHAAYFCALGALAFGAASFFAEATLLNYVRAAVFFGLAFVLAVFFLHELGLVKARLRLVGWLLLGFCLLYGIFSAAFALVNLIYIFQAHVAYGHGTDYILLVNLPGIIFFLAQCYVLFLAAWQGVKILRAEKGKAIPHRRRV